MTRLSRLFPRSRRFNAYNLGYLPEGAVHLVDSVVGAFMLVRSEAICKVGLLDEAYFMYGEDLDWAKRIKTAGWEIWYNGEVEVTHLKEASSRRSRKARLAFYDAMWIFYRKHYRADSLVGARQTGLARNRADWRGRHCHAAVETAPRTRVETPCATASSPLRGGVGAAFAG